VLRRWGIRSYLEDKPRGTELETRMKIKELITKIAKKEGKKVQTPVGNIREIVSIISDLCVKDPSVISALISNGQKRKK